MTKKEFLVLAKKHGEGLCSKEEEQVLYDFCDSAQIKDSSAIWNLSEEEHIKIQLLKRIKYTLRSKENQKQKIKNRIQIRTVAAVLIGLMVASYFYVQFRFFENIPIPENAITLEHEDGTIEVLQENSTNLLYNTKGALIAQQQGNRLVYKDKKQRLDEMVYNTLKVPYGKRFELELSDGTIVQVNAGSSLTYPIQFQMGNDRQVFVTGEAYLSVAKDSIHPFIVHADKLNVSVLGTKFNVHAYPEDPISEIVLVEGSVSLYSDSQKYDEKKKKPLRPGYKASFDKENNTIIEETVLTEIYTSWLNGELVFRNMTFENILKKLERHYNVNIINTNYTLSKTVLNASFGNETIEVILESLKDNYGIDYSINDQTIIINN